MRLRQWRAVDAAHRPTLLEQSPPVFQLCGDGFGLGLEAKQRLPRHDLGVFGASRVGRRLCLTCTHHSGAATQLLALGLELPCSGCSLLLLLRPLFSQPRPPLCLGVRVRVLSVFSSIVRSYFPLKHAHLQL